MRGSRTWPRAGAAAVHAKIAGVKLRVVAVGKLREPSLVALANEFRRRLSRYDPFEEVEVASAHGADPRRAVAAEGQRVLRALEPAETCWLLERSGDELSSLELSERLRGAASTTARLTLVVGGTYGASDELLARADFKWSLSRLTLLHEWARVIVLEQLYRAAKIARNEPYHH